MGWGETGSLFAQVNADTLGKKTIDPDSWSFLNLHLTVRLKMKLFERESRSHQWIHWDRKNSNNIHGTTAMIIWCDYLISKSTTWAAGWLEEVSISPPPVAAALSGCCPCCGTGGIVIINTRIDQSDVILHMSVCVMTSHTGTQKTTPHVSGLVVEQCFSHTMHTARVEHLQWYRYCHYHKHPPSSVMVGPHRPMPPIGWA